MEQNSYSLKQLESLCDHAPCGMGVFASMDDAPIYLNDAYYKLVGYTKEEYEKELNNNGYGLMVLEDTHITEKNIEDFNDSPQNLCSEYRIRQKCGDVKWVRLTVSPFIYNEKSYGLCFFEDITAQKENLFMLKSISDNTGLSISVLRVKDDSATIVYANDMFYKYIGISKEELGNSANGNFSENVSLEDKQRINDSVQQALSTGKEQDIQYFYKIKNGQTKYLNRRLSAIKSPDGSFLIFSVTTDMTALKQAEIKQKEEHDRLKMVMEEMNTAIFEWNMETGDFYTNGNYGDYAMSEVDSNRLLHNEGPLDLIHPDDIPELLRYAKEAETDAHKVEASLRLRLKAGGYRWVHIAAIRTLNEHGVTIKTTGVVTDISKEKESEMQLRKNDEKLEQIVKSISGGVAVYHIHKDYKVTTEYISEGLATMCGYTHREFFELLKDDAMSNVVEADRKQVLDAVTEAINGDGMINVVYRIYKKDKSTLLIRLNASLTKENHSQRDYNEIHYCYAIHTVVTDYEQRVMQKQEQNKAILDRLDIAYFGWNINEKPYYSEQFKRYALSQAPMEKIMSNTAGNDYIYPDDIEILQRFFKDKNTDDGKTSAKIRMKMFDGSYRLTSILRFSEHDKSGKLISALGVFMDVDEEWIEQNAHLKIALKQLETAKKTKDLFFAQMSHDLRTPLNAVINLSDFAKESIDNKEELIQYIDSIYSSGQLLLGLVNDGLDLEKAEIGSIVLNPTEYSYSEFKKSIITIIEPLCKQKEIKLCLTNELENYFIIADKVRFEQIFINLFSNAVKFTPKGGKIEFLCINKKATDTRFECDFVVRDNGIGMSKEFQEKMFIPFEQENIDIVFSTNGTGLGLSIVKKLVDLMNGTISVKSEKGKGTEITVHLAFPYVKERIVKAEMKSSKNLSLKNKTIMLVEDHSLNAMIAVKLLEKEGMKVVLCENGKIAVEQYAQSKQNTFDAILMDMNMPVMDGLEATKKIRSLERQDSKTVPIIAMSANTFHDDIEACLEAGMNEHLAKPIEPKMLYEYLQRYIQR